MTLILHSYTDVRIEDQLETQENIIRIAAVYGTSVISQKMIADDDYWSFLLRHWNKGHDLVIIEQDVVATLPFIDELVTCQRKLCCFPYRLRDKRWSVWDNYVPPAERHNIANWEYYTNPYEVLPDYARCSALGFTKICQCIQKKIPLHLYPVDKYKWWYLDSWISEKISRLRRPTMFHVHQPPVRHNRSLEMKLKVDGQEIQLTEDTTVRIKLA